MNEFGNRLQRFRKEKHYSIREVSNKLCVAESTYRDWEQGREIKGEPYVKMSHFFDISLYELMTGDTGKVKPILDKVNHVKIILNKIQTELGSLL
ncbi:MAG: helix-turn-helix transcriptional regulator [Bacteriovoracaceae bacterium]|nr:helix-turn-helix transcriptional regulator [Bacteriovoracaceae bacterium]